MPYSETLADRIREKLVHLSHVEEKKMMGGLCFMVNDKMCIGIMKDEMMCRIAPDMYEKLLDEPGCRPMAFSGKTMKGYVLVDEYAIKTEKEFEKWIQYCLDFNPHAKSSKKKK